MDGAPKCGVCSHHHDPGTKCPICGHTGRSRIFQILQHRPLANVFSVRGFDCLEKPPVMRNLDRNLLCLTTILRGRIFPQVSASLPDDPQARHMLAFVGDAPIGTARWRVSAEHGAQVVEIELLGVLVDKRKLGYGKNFLQNILEDVNNRLNELNASCQAIVAHVPEHDTFAVAAVKLFESTGFRVDPQRHERQGVSFFRLVLTAPK
ncbi:hypothetical protein Poli38472_009683 [Pythium oligandrum]|uniref:N-acetyltransferase domain-containing protein n=1 Tax=Pythium oligandrum TaxID=41045 RepID=A0A8K1FFY7_PYTOL|nr:hypothetical protein Poli38472_009683 [Pythium oligandrum]|eukprot:TMW62190.1 hypothetical protein Poli38472_009683 [Pythium oligandrum]